MFANKRNEIYLFIFTITTLVISFVWNYFIREYREFDFFLFYTHLSIILVFAYLFSSIFINNKKIIVLSLPAITLTGIVYMGAMFLFNYFSWLTWIIHPSLNPYEINSLLYFFVSTILTLFMHLIIPIFFYEITKEDFIKNTTFSKGVITNLIFMSIYFVFVEIIMFTIGGIGIDGGAPYFFLDLRNIDIYQIITYVLIYIIIIELMVNINYYLTN